MSNSRHAHLFIFFGAFSGKIPVLICLFVSKLYGQIDNFTRPSCTLCIFFLKGDSRGRFIPFHMWLQSYDFWKGPQLYLMMVHEPVEVLLPSPVGGFLDHNIIVPTCTCLWVRKMHVGMH